MEFHELEGGCEVLGGGVKNQPFDSIRFILHTSGRFLALFLVVLLLLLLGLCVMEWCVVIM